MGRIYAIKDMDINQGDGVNVSVWFSGCPHKCEGCHNLQTWNKNQGEYFNSTTVKHIEYILTKDDIHKNLSILGGEPLSEYNIGSCLALIEYISNVLPKTQIWLWTGYTLEELEELYGKELIEFFQQKLYCLIDGRYIKEQHDVTRYKGSKNQNIYKFK